MNPLGWIALFFIATYLVHAGLLRWGVGRARFRRTEQLPSVLILVAARNEEKNLPACMESLVAVDYPRDLLQILILDDGSSDRTLEIAQWYGTRYPFVHAIRLNERLPGLSGKASAICQGLDEGSGELVLVTDADCVVPRTWVKTYVSYYTPDVGIVGGFTLLDRKEDGASLFAKVQSVDWLYLVTVGAGAAGLGKPVSVLGNNFSFRRAAYDAVGGYRNLGFSIIEDFSLMQAVIRRTGWRVCFPLSCGASVYSKPMTNLDGFYHQRKRWAAGGKEVSTFAKILMTSAFATHLSLTLCLLLPSLMPIGLAGFLLVLGADAALLWPSSRALMRKDLLRYLLPFEAFYFLYTTFFAPVVLLPTKVKWKGVLYEWKPRGTVNQADASSLADD